jgi:ubiquinone/menaquinone biosynthesis C-methylase UbiE
MKHTDPKQAREEDEFGQFIDGYRDLQDKHLWMSGESSGFFAQYKAEKLAEWLPHLADKEVNVLDYGAGDGVMSSYVKTYFSKAQVAGCDISQSSVDAANLQYSDIAFKTITNKTLPYESGSFDIIFSAGVFHHILFEEHMAWLSEITRVLKPDGYFVMFEINPLNPVANYVFRHHPVDKDATMLTPWYARKIVKSKGKTISKFYCFFPKFLQFFRRFEKYMTWIPFGAHHAHILHKVKKS